ncbi:MAG: hypothetical protein JWN40_2254 [Phycisphaerales bacterium]|nr:hypothetical protein [Phycisphaerales bacterium]
MRSFLAGILSFILPAVAFAQAVGGVETIGFGDYFRPGSWTPMLVYLKPTTGSNFTGRIEVVQEDVDRDQVLFSRQITLTGNPPNSSAVEQRFWMYFLPQPNTGREALDETRTLGELSNLIKVRLCSESGKELVKLPITRTLRPVGLRTGSNSSYGAPTRGEKIVLCVYDKSPPNFSEYSNALTAGLNEEVIQVTARDMAKDLPDRVIGYDAVDAICWSDADPTKLGTDQVAAIEQFVRRGGRLVFTQDTTTNQWQRNNVIFPLLMPVNVRGVEERDDGAETLRQLAKAPERAKFQPFLEPWDKLKGPFHYAVAEVKPGAFVTHWQKDAKGELFLDAEGKPKPYAVRIAAGAGSVTWVAQDLSDRQVTGDRESTSGWVNVWDSIYDWRNEPVRIAGRDPIKDPALKAVENGSTWELGRSFHKYMDLPSKSAALIGIAVLFFLVYWVVAGPGSYLVLLKKGKSLWSWFIFAAIAIVAVGLTVGITKLVLRGSPDMRHISVVRMAPGEPVRAHSNFGLYVPRDGDQRIELTGTAPNRASYVTAFNLHPALVAGDSAEFPARQAYHVPVKEIHEAGQEAADPRVIFVPYRSTLKKFQAEWIGKQTDGSDAAASAPLPAGIDGTVKLSSEIPLVTGTLSNNTGHDLRMVYFVVHNPGIDTGGTTVAQDLVLYVSYWPKGGRVSLTNEFQIPAKGGAKYINVSLTQRDALYDDTNPNTVKTYQGHIAFDNHVATARNWTDYWYKDEAWHNGSYAESRQLEEKDPLRPKSFPILSFYDRLPVSRNKRDGGLWANDRIDFTRRGLRDLDCSAAISAGNMVIIAVSGSSDEPLPFPMEVQGETVAGQGTVYYQFTIPADRSAVQKDPTAPAATQPVKGKAEG